MEQESMGAYEEREKRREGLGVEEWRAGILAGSVLSVPFDYRDEGRASKLIEEPSCISEGFIRPKDEAGLTPLGPPLTSSIPNPPGRTYRESTLRQSLGLIVGAGLLWILTSQVPTQHHVALLSHTHPAIARTWQFITPSSAVDQYRALVKRIELDRWIEEERVIAWNRITNNIGPAAGASDGIIIASPSSGKNLTEPDYYYTWTRDAALTISAMLPAFLPEEYLQPWLYQTHNGSHNHTEPDQPLLEATIRSYIQSQAAIQIATNPSGDLWTGGLNEPKFHVDGSRFDGEWGRPQIDGPALRALAMIPYAHFLLDRGWPADILYVEKHLYNPKILREAGSVIKNDLEEVGGGWWHETFDLWEEVQGHHLFTLLACLRALQAGSQLANRLKDPKAAEFYTSQADRIVNILPAFWDEKDYWRASAHIDEDWSQSYGSERSGLDCAFPLSVVHAGSPDFLAALDSETLATLRAYIGSFEGMYSINKRTTNLGKGQTRPWRDGWAVGRYPEDIYNGIGVSRGNPWHICTLSIANVLYLAKEGFDNQGYISLNNLTRPFWQDLLGEQYMDSEDLWTSNGKGMFGIALQALMDTGDKFMAVSKEYAPDGRMAEQIDRNDGSPVGARDLTWSYASFLEAARARERAAG